jgi:hypothetical protein
MKKATLFFKSFLNLLLCLIIFSCNKDAVPSVTTSEVTLITQNSAVCGGTIKDNGGSIILSRGVCWSTSQNPTIDESKTSDSSGIGSFISNISNLTANISYFIRAYSTNSSGTA